METFAVTVFVGAGAFLVGFVFGTILTLIAKELS